MSKPAAPPDLDDSALQRLRRFGGDKLVREMAALFIEHAPARLVTARQALAKGEANTIKAALHALKSSTGQVGAARMHRLCEQGEQQAATGDISGIASILEQLEADMPAVRSWLLQSAGEAA